MTKWLPIIDYKGFYEVSNFGEVRSVDRELICFKGNTRYIQFHRGRIIKPYLGDGYPTVNLSKNNKSKTHRIHILVLTAFRGPCPKGLVSCHLDDIKTNIKSSNLVWGTRKENAEDALLNGKRTPHKLTEPKVRRMKELWNTGEWTKRELQWLFGVSYRMIWLIVNNQLWRHVTV